MRAGKVSSGPAVHGMSPAGQMLQPGQGDKKVSLGTKEVQFSPVGDRGSNFGCSHIFSDTYNICSGNSQPEPRRLLQHPDLLQDVHINTWSSEQFL